MLFSSILFLFLFFPLVLGGYYLIRKEFKNHFLLFVSLIFYAWGEPKYILIMFLSIFLNYYLAILIEKSKSIYILIFTVIINLLILGFFKYLNFLFGIINQVFEIPRLYSFSERIVLPIGISFFTFQAMSYCIDVYYGRVSAQKNLSKVALYISFFPQLIAGPIVRYIDISREIDNRNESFDEFVLGLRRFIIGLSKKVLIANVLAVGADRAFQTEPSELNISFALIGALFYTFQIFFDFSGYSDMAIGLGRMFGFRFLENFNSPYSALSLRDFWRRWHISLSSWFRDYLYLPLGGNRNGNYRTWFNLVIVFLLCGLWHGANWTFIVWGLWHGVFLVLERTQFGKWLDMTPQILQRTYALVVIMVGWVFFRSNSLEHAVSYLSAILVIDSEFTRDHILNYINNEVIVCIIFAIILSSEEMKGYLKRVFDRLQNKVISEGIINFALLLLFFFSCTKLALGTYNPFIYFRF